MSTNDKFCQKCQELIEKTNESTWRLPLDKKMIQAVKCDSADLKNISPEMKAGSSMGGAFLTHFVPDSTSYIHLDIAGPAFRTKPS
jgi:leucyl aminopeptidase